MLDEKIGLNTQLIQYGL